MEISEIRRANLQRIAATYPSKTEFAAVIEREPDQLGHLLSGRRNIGNKLAKHIERCCKLTSGSLSQNPLDQIGLYNPPPELDDHNAQLVKLLTTRPLPREDAALVLTLIERLHT